MHKVKRAIIFAAGIGQRMRPLSFSMPKPLVNVCGKRIIETIIDGLHDNGIFDICIVVGYMAELFEYLKVKYEGISLRYNDQYDKCNNISSLYVAKDYLDDVIIVEGDIVIKNPKVLSRQFDKSGYNAVWTECHTNEWLMDVKDNKVVSCSRTGGEKGWQLYGISRWTKEDGLKLKELLEKEYITNNNRQIYWDDVAMFCHPESFNLGIYKMQSGDVIEIDNYSELAHIDERYRI